MATPSDSSVFIAPIDPPKSIDELRERPQFVAPLDHKQHKLTEVLAAYSFGTKIPCGLSTCQQRHFHGLLVKTASGHETNIGHVCGKVYFGEDFVIAHSKYNKSVERRDALERLKQLKEVGPAVLRKVAEMTDAPFGVHWVWSLSKAIEGRIGTEALNHLKLRARREDYKVTRTKELSSVELDMAVENTGKRRDELRYVHEVLGQLQPMRWLNYDFRATLIDGISVPLRALDNLSGELLDTKSLQKGLKVVTGYENRLEEARSVLEQAKQVFSPANLVLLDEAISEFARHRKVGTSSMNNLKLGGALSSWQSTSQFKSIVAGKVL